MDNSSTNSRWPRAVSTAILAGAAYLLAGLLSRSVADAETQTLPVWLAAGVGFGALWVAGPGSGMAVILGTLAGSYIWGLCAHDLGMIGSAPFAALEVAAIGAGAWMARRETDAGGASKHPIRRMAWLVAGALLTAALGATLAAEYWYRVRPSTDYASEWQTWASSTVLGILLVAPVVDAFRHFRVRRSGGMPSTQFSAGAVAFSIFLLVAWLVFGPGTRERFGPLAPTLVYLPMPFLLLAALLWGPIGGSLAVLGGALLLISRTAAGDGPFAVAEGFRGEAVIEVQAYVALWVMLVLLVQGLSAGRRQAFNKAKELQLRYERALEATGVASAEFDAINGSVVWSRQADSVLGFGIDAVLDIGNWLACVDLADRSLAEQSWRALARGDSGAATDQYAVWLAGKAMRVQVQWATLRGPDGAVERVVALIRRVDDPAQFRANGFGGRIHG